MSNIVPIDQAALNVPAAMRARVQQGLATNSGFSDGVRDSFPVLSIRGKSFHARINGQETPFIDPQTRSAIGHLDVVLVSGSRTLAKTYYIRGYTPGDLNPPDCWSMDSIRPDASVPNKVSISCITCPMNMFGSARPRDNQVPEPGKRTGKACQDSRRIAVMMPHMIGAPEPLVMMLRVPQSSLKNLKNYAQMLERHGIDPAGAITRLQFDYAEAFPKLLFNFVNVLDDASYTRVVDLGTGDMVKGMLNAPDFDNAPSVTPVQNPQAGPVLQPLSPQQPPVLNPLAAGVDDDEGEVGPQVIPGLTMPPAGPVSANPPVGIPVVPQANLSQPIHPSPMPPMATAPVITDNMIELPDGRYYDRTTNSFVEKVATPEPAPDPNIISLPNGQYYNVATKQYVAAPGSGAAPAPAAPVAAPVTRKRAAPAKKEPAKEPTPEPAAKVEEVAVPIQQTQKWEGDKEQAVENNGDSHPGAAVSSTSKSLDDILRSVLPPTRTQ